MTRSIKDKQQQQQQQQGDYSQLDFKELFSSGTLIQPDTPDSTKNPGFEITVKGENEDLDSASGFRDFITSQYKDNKWEVLDASDLSNGPDYRESGRKLIVKSSWIDLWNYKDADGYDGTLPSGDHSNTNLIKFTLSYVKQDGSEIYSEYFYNPVGDNFSYDVPDVTKGIELPSGNYVIQWSENASWGTTPYNISVSEENVLTFPEYGYTYTWSERFGKYEDYNEYEEYGVLYTLKIGDNDVGYTIIDGFGDTGTVVATDPDTKFTLTSITTETEYDNETALPVDTDFLITYTGDILSDNAVLEIKDVSKISLIDDGESRNITSQIITHEGKSTLQVKPDSNLPRDSNFQLQILEGALKSEKDAEEFVNKENVFYYSTNNEEPEDTTSPVLTADLVDSINEGQTSLGSISANEPVVWSVDNTDDIKLTVSNTQENTVIVSLKTGADLADGFYLYTITAADPSGNTSSFTKTVNVIDTTPPEPPILNSIKPTNDSTPTINGKAEPGSIVDLFNGATLLGSGIADSAGNFSITCSPLDDRTYLITATATDEAGNISAVSSELSITIDTTSPVLTDNLVDSINEGQTSLGSIRANEPVVWSVDNTDDIKLTVSNTQENTVIVSLKTGADLADGFYLYTITAADQSDNTSSVTTTVNVVEPEPDVIITNTDNSTQYVMLRSSDNGVLDEIQKYKDTNGNEIVKANIKEVVIQGSVTEISIKPVPNTINLHDGAFEDCIKLQSVTIGDSVTSINAITFRSCIALDFVTIPTSVTSIGYRAFENCVNLKSVTIPDSVTRISNYTFYNCISLKSVTIPDSVTSIGVNAFAYCYDLQPVTIPDSVTSIGRSAFSKCNELQSVTIPDSVTSLGEGAFSGCIRLQSVTIGDSVPSIDYSAFNYCRALQSVTIGDSVQTIGYQAFEDCIKLENVTLPDSVTSIGDRAFQFSGLKTIYVTPNNKMIKNGKLQFGTNKTVGKKSGVTVISSLNLNIYTYPINGNIKDFDVKVFDSNNNEIPNLNTVTNLTNKNGYYKFSFVKPEGSTNTYRVRTTTLDGNYLIIKSAVVTFTDEDYEKTVYVGVYSDFLALFKKEIKKILQNSDNEDVKQLTDEQIDEFISEGNYTISIGEGADSITLFELSLEMYINTIKNASKDNDIYAVQDALKTVLENFLNSEEIKTLIIQTAVDNFVNRESNGLSITSKNQLDTIATKIRSEQIISSLVGLTSTDLGTPFDANTIDAVVRYGDGVYDKMKESLDSNPTLTIDDKITSMSKVYTASVTKLENDDSENRVPESIPTDEEIANAIPENIPSFNPRPESEPQPEPEPEPDMTQEITVAPGWNWISFYLRQDDNSLNNIQLTDFEGNQVPLLFMKDQNNFSEYYGENTGWFGALTEIDVEKTFLFKNNSDSLGKLTITGQKEDFVGIQLLTGWNWIGYPRSESATLWTVNNTDGLLREAKDGDFIKDQNNFATYYDGLGWFGALTTLEPGKGYFYKSVEDNFLVFSNYDDDEFIPPSNSQ